MKKGLTQMVFVLDMSGSMSPLTMETIGGYNAMIADQKKEEGDALVTTVLFDHRYNMIHDGVNIKEVENIHLTKKQDLQCVLFANLQKTNIIIMCLKNIASKKNEINIDK